MANDEDIGVKVSIDGQFTAALPIEGRLLAIHERIRTSLGLEQIGRISVATYDEDQREISVFAFSDVHDKPLRLYSCAIDQVPSLKALADSGKARIISDLRTLDASQSLHTRSIGQHYRSSLTLPIRQNGVLYGFIFFNSEQPNFFTNQVVESVLPYALLLSSMVVADIMSFRTLKAAIRTAQDIGSFRDNETSGHLVRMAAYTRRIGVKVAGKFDLNERRIDLLQHFALMHDVGKIAIPDHILFKPARLNADEAKIMRTHVESGVKIVEALLANFHIVDPMFGSMLRNVVECHHETLDGRGYPRGLAGNDIPIEGRIIAVADIFDALTSVRPYKPAWTIDESLGYLRERAGVTLDPDCVDALFDSRAEIERIRRATEFDDLPFEPRTDIAAESAILFGMAHDAPAEPAGGERPRVTRADGPKSD